MVLSKMLVAGFRSSVRTTLSPFATKTRVPPQCYASIRTYRNLETDDYGRQISARSRPSSSSGDSWFDEAPAPKESGGWDDFDPVDSESGAGRRSSKPQRRVSQPRDRGSNNRRSSNDSFRDNNSRSNNEGDFNPRRGDRDGGDYSRRGDDRRSDSGGDYAPRRGGDRRSNNDGDFNSRRGGDRRFDSGGDFNSRRGGDRRSNDGGDYTPRRGGDRRSNNDGDYNSRRGGDRRFGNDGGFNSRQGGGDRRGRGNGRNGDTEMKPGGQINMKVLEAAGYVHLYGLSSIQNALKAGVRDFTDPKLAASKDDAIDDYLSDEFDDDEDGESDEAYQSSFKPEAQAKPWLFVQQKASETGRTGSKAASANRVLELAEEKGIPIMAVDKGVLNTLSGNRPHQGYVLRCGQLSFEPLSQIPHPSKDANAPSFWLVLDEVVDPQNLGALLRSAFFLGGENGIGILVCAKNSAPPSPVVSAASAGALELSTIYSTANLPRTLNQAREDGFRIVGASSSAPRGSGGDADDDESQLFELQDLPTLNKEQPVLLVLGSEGHGLRTLVSKACTEFVRVPGGSEEETAAGDAGVDSLNVSVTGGILLWHLLHGNR